MNLGCRALRLGAMEVGHQHTVRTKGGPDSKAMASAKIGTTKWYAEAMADDFHGNISMVHTLPNLAKRPGWSRG